MVNIKLHLYFPGWVGGWGGVVIIKLKANLSSTSHLTSQLELSLSIHCSHLCKISIPILIQMSEHLLSLCNRLLPVVVVLEDHDEDVHHLPQGDSA